METVHTQVKRSAKHLRDESIPLVCKSRPIITPLVAYGMRKLMGAYASCCSDVASDRLEASLKQAPKPNALSHYHVRQLRESVQKLEIFTLDLGARSTIGTLKANCWPEILAFVQCQLVKVTLFICTSLPPEEEPNFHAE